MNWKEFIESIREGAFGKRFSDDGIANITGLRRESIYKLRKGIVTEPFQDTIEKFEKGFNIKIDARNSQDISYEFVSEDQPEITIQKNYIDNKKQSSELEKTIELFNGRKVYLYPLITKAFAGQPFLSDIDYGSARKEMFQYYVEGHVCFCLEVDGNSMEPTLTYGDLVLADTNLAQVDGDIVAVKLKNGNHYIKRFKDLSYQLVLLTSDNSKYEPMVIDKNDIISLHPIVEGYTLKIFKR